MGYLAAGVIAGFLLTVALAVWFHRRQQILADEVNSTLHELVDQTNKALEQHRERLADLELIHATLYGPFGKVKAPKC